MKARGWLRSGPILQELFDHGMCVMTVLLLFTTWLANRRLLAWLAATTVLLHLLTIRLLLKLQDLIIDELGVVILRLTSFVAEVEGLLNGCNGLGIQLRNLLLLLLLMAIVQDLLRLYGLICSLFLNTVAALTQALRRMRLLLVLGN